MQNPNPFMPNDHIVITPLEFAVFMGEAKLTALLFLYGADPIHNTIFDHEGAIYFERVEDIYNPKEPIKGFEGLEQLVDRNDANMKALLRLLKFLNDESITLGENYNGLVLSLRQIARVLEYSDAEAQAFIVTSMLSMKQTGMPDNIAREITENALRLHLREVLTKYAKVRRSPRFRKDWAEIWVY